MPVQTSVAIAVNAPLAQAFDIAASIEPKELIQKFGPLPAIIETQGHDAPWSAVGQTRNHILSDKSSVKETLTAFTRNSTFAYDLTDFTGAFASLTRNAHAEWHFTKLGAIKTQIDWTYVFHGVGPISDPILWFLVKTLWPNYQRAALRRLKENIENI